ncbi:hypothetical protein BV898_03135 [Hypsibius exemplaris]|uniref:J domain-containing protein n=1 Tax=Hypsibius exemplaris TaxID=2072580 RepID=A0A1W0X6T4_HYPEX|nr:hypothetical protein BV898_03135 [Hypsibius exemplaris]
MVIGLCYSVVLIKAKVALSLTVLYPETFNANAVTQLGLKGLQYVFSVLNPIVFPIVSQNYGMGVLQMLGHNPHHQRNPASLLVETLPKRKSSVTNSASAASYLFRVIAKFCPQNLYAAVDELVSFVSQTGSNNVMIGLAVIFLCKETCDNINKWWRGEISGLRCAKNTTDASITIGAGVGGGAGGAGGAALGGLVAGPLGALVGGIVGGFMASSGTNVVIDRMTQWLFGVPKETALENAYNFIGVKMTASNHDINQKYYALSLRCHPDRPNGNTEDFQILQFHMAVIKAARGELH